MKKIIILCGSVFAVILTLNIILNYFMLSVILAQIEKNNEFAQQIKDEIWISSFGYPNTDNNHLPTMALPDEEIALEVGKALLEEYYGATDGIYVVYDRCYYWSVLNYKVLIESYTVSLFDEEHEMMLVEMANVDINKKDGRVLYTEYLEKVELRADALS